MRSIKTKAKPQKAFPSFLYNPEALYNPLQLHFTKSTTRTRWLIATAAIKASHKHDIHILDILQTSHAAPASPPVPLPVSFPFRFLQNCIRNDQFFGREEQMTRLDSIFSQPYAQSIQSVVIHGLGGSGKSSLAKEYMYRRMGRYDVVLWVHADNVSKLNTQFISLARALGIFTHEGQAREAVLHFINNLRS